MSSNAPTVSPDSDLRLRTGLIAMEEACLPSAVAAESAEVRSTELGDAGRLADKSDVTSWIMQHDAAESARRVRIGGPTEPLPVGAPV